MKREAKGGPISESDNAKIIEYRMFRTKISKLIMGRRTRCRRDRKREFWRKRKEEKSSVGKGEEARRHKEKRDWSLLDPLHKGREEGMKS